MKVLGLKMTYMNIILLVFATLGVVQVLTLLKVKCGNIEYMTGGHGENSHNPDGSHNFSDPVPTLN